MDRNGAQWKGAWTRLGMLALLAVIALVIAACDEGGADGADTAADGTDTAADEADTAADEEDPSDDEPADEDPTDEPDDEPEDPPEEATDEDDAEDSAEVVVATGDTDLGTVLVDHDGLTLYMFDPDEGGESTCYDDCADNWPPLTSTDAPTAGDGTDPGLIGTVPRDDGDDQITYNDWPLYYWAGDNDAGDVNGQAVQDVWWVLDPEGTPIRDEEDANDDEVSGPSY